MHLYLNIPRRVCDLLATNESFCRYFNEQDKINDLCLKTADLTLQAPITTKVVCFSRLLKCLRSLYGKQCGARSDCSYRSSLFWVQAVCFYTLLVSNVRQLFAADDFSRRHFHMHFFLGALRVKLKHSTNSTDTTTVVATSKMWKMDHSGTRENLLNSRPENSLIC